MRKCRRARTVKRTAYEGSKQIDTTKEKVETEVETEQSGLYLTTSAKRTLVRQHGVVLLDETVHTDVREEEHEEMGFGDPIIGVDVVFIDDPIPSSGPPTKADLKRWFETYIAPKAQRLMCPQLG